jgi:hypothetical protein
MTGVVIPVNPRGNFPRVLFLCPGERRLINNFLLENLIRL